MFTFILYLKIISKMVLIIMQAYTVGAYNVHIKFLNFTGLLKLPTHSLFQVPYIKILIIWLRT